MSTAPVVIKVAGRAKRANLQGETIWREEEIFVPSYRAWYRTLDTHDHFVYYQSKRLGTTMQCSCGSAAGIFKPDVYLERFQSVNLGEVIACISLMETGKHADGSSG